MPISQTSFEQRVNRINRGQTPDAKAKNKRSKKRRSLRQRCLTVPFLVGVGILLGGTGYAYVETQPGISVNASVHKVMAYVDMAGL